MAIVKSADRVILILETISVRDNGITHGELSRISGIPKGSLSPLLSNLVDRDYLIFDASSKRYVLGPKLMALSSRYLSTYHLVRISRPIMQDLVGEINEDAELAVMKDSEILFLYGVDSSRPLRHVIAVGDRAPAYPIAAGKAILAYLPDGEIADYLSTVTLTPFTENTITDPDALRHELQKVRSEGVASGYGEYYEDINSIAAPIFNMYGRVAGSLVVPLLSIRLDPERYRFIDTRLRSAAARISRQLGFEADTKRERVAGRRKEEGRKGARKDKIQ